MTNINLMSNFIWGTADLIRHKFSRGDYQEVILPFTVLRRIDCVLEPTKDEVLEVYEQRKDQLNPTALNEMLKRAAGAPFYNYSPFTFKRLLDEPGNIKTNINEYIHSFSPNMQDVLENFEFENTIDALAKHDLLYKVVKRFCSPKIDLHPDNLPNSQMGDVFEELIRKFNESLDENPGEHFTPREVVHLMAELAIDLDRHDFQADQIMHVYDPCCGTGGMLTETESRIQEINDEVEVWLFGQEVNPETYAVCKADMYMKGEEERAAENIADRSTLSHDAFPDKQFDYMLANPPYGYDWKGDAEAVEAEADQGFGGRFGAGLPAKSDGQLLFLQNMLAKQQDPSDGGSRIAFISNASPLFTADPNISESKNECSIRRWILENDFLETLIRLPGEMFYNTGITTYVWVLSNRKEAERDSKVQLIDASGEEFWTLMPQNKGQKRREITNEQIQSILKIYRDYEDGEYAQIHPVEEFGYRKVRIERPLRENYRASEERIERLHDERAFGNRDEDRQQEIIAMLEGMDDTKYTSRDEFESTLETAVDEARLDLTSTDSVWGNILSALAETDPDAEIVTDGNGDPERDTDLTDYEYVPLDEDVEEYFQREVKPYVEDAWINEDMTDPKDGKLGKVGYEINFNRYFYEYEPPRPLEEIEEDIAEVEGEILDMIEEVAEV